MLVLSVHCSLAVTCWERPLGSLVCDVLLCFSHFPCGLLGQVWNLIVSIPYLCLLTNVGTITT